MPDSSTQTGDSGSANNGTADGTGAADDQDNDGNTAADSQQSESKGFLGAIVDFFTSLLGDNADSDSNEGNAGADNGSGNFNDGTDTSSDASDTASQNNFNEGSDADADGSDADAESDPAPAAPTADELAQLDDAVTVTVPGMADVQSADLKLADGTYTIGQVASDDNGGWTVPIAISPASYLVAGAKALQQANPNLKASGLDLDANATQSVITLVYRPAMSFDFDFSGKGGDRSAPSRSWQLATPATVALSLRDGVNADAATLAADGKGLDLNQIKDLLKLVKTYTLKFGSNGGTPVLPQVGVVAQIEIVPGHPTKLPVSNVLVVSIACRKITDSMNISQEQCKQFLSNFGVAKEPAAPKRLGYTFAGWYTDAALTTPFTAWNKAITDNQTLHAKWTRSSFTVRFDSNGGTVVLPRTVKAGEPMTSLPTPKRAFRQFDGWYTDKTWSKRWTTADPVTSDMTLVAHWVKKNFLVTFDSNWGTPVLPQLVRNGGTVTRPEDPVRAMRYFDGWYTDKTWTTRYDFSQPVTSNMTLVAHWVKNAPGKCAVRYRGMPIGVTNPNSVQVECLPDGEGNYTFTLKSPSVRKGYEFLGWHWQVEAADVPSDALTEGDADVSEDGTTTLTVPSNTDITLTPRWETAADDKPAGKPDDKPGQQPGDNVSGDDNSNGDGNNDGNGSANGGSSSNGSSPNGSAGNNSGSANGSQTGASNVTNGSGSQQTSAKQTSGQGSNQSNPLAITGAAVSVVAAIALVAAIIGVALVVERKRN